MPTLLGRMLAGVGIKLDKDEVFCAGMFVVAAIYALVNGQANTILGGMAFMLIMLGALPRQRSLAILVGASVIVLLQRRMEGFQSGAAAADKVAKKEEAEKKEDVKHEEEKQEEKATEAAEEPKKEEAGEAFAGGKPMLPDNRERREPLVLGKAYKLPSENDDKGFHLDAGTTFLNAYKALKPDQIASMTKDTQELLATQKSLVSMLDSFAPLLKDMNKITGFFGQ
jgi:hypothetical protein